MTTRRVKTVSTTKKAGAKAKRKRSALPKCTVSLVGARIQTADGATYACTTTDTGVRVWVVASVATATPAASPTTTRPQTSPAAPPAPAAPTPAAPAPAAPAPVPAPSPVVPPTVSVAEATKTPTTLQPAATTPPSQTTTPTTIPSQGPGALTIAARGKAGNTATFNLDCFSSTAKYASAFRITVGEFIKLTDLKAPIQCEISNLRAGPPDANASLTVADTTAPTTDFKALVKPLPLPAATFTINIGSVDRPVVGSGPLVKQ